MPERDPENPRAYSRLKLYEPVYAGAGVGSPHPDPDPGPKLYEPIYLGVSGRAPLCGLEQTNPSARLCGLEQCRLLTLALARVSVASNSAGY